MRTADLLWVLLLAIISVDCYGDDLLGAAGLPSESLLSLSVPLRAAFLVYTILLLLGVIWVLRRIDRLLGADRDLRSPLIFMASFAVGFALVNLAIRLWLAAIPDLVDKTQVPVFWFVFAYAERLVVYAAIALASIILLAKIPKSRLPGGTKAGSILAVAAVLAVTISILSAGLATLASSPHWRGEPMVHSKVYMGTIPRDLAMSLEPWVTCILLLGLGTVAVDVLRASRDGNPWWFPAFCLFLGILVQTLPRIGRGLLVTAISATDLYYPFRLDRSLAFPLIPALMLSLGIVLSRLIVPRRELLNAA